MQHWKKKKLLKTKDCNHKVVHSDFIKRQKLACLFSLSRVDSFQLPCFFFKFFFLMRTRLPEYMMKILFEWIEYSWQTRVMLLSPKVVDCTRSKWRPICCIPFCINLWKLLKGFQRDRAWGDDQFHLLSAA